MENTGVTVQIIDDYLILENLTSAMEGAVLNTLPDSFTSSAHASGNQAVYVPWTYHNAAWLTAVNLPAVSPIMRDYHFPCPPTWKVMEHQLRIGEFASRNRRGYVLAGMGSGKTASLLWTTDYLMSLGEIKKVLIICPVAVVYDAWMPTVPQLFLSNRSISNLHKKKDAYKDDTDYHVINIDKMDIMIDQLLTVGYDAVIIDESTKIKNMQAKRTKAVKRLVSTTKFSWQLTGRPCPQGPLDAHGQIAVFNRYSFSRAWWEDATMIDYGNYRKVPRAGWQDLVHQYMQPAIRVETRDCIDLPPVTYIRQFIPLTATQDMAIKALKRDRAVFLADKEITSVHAGALLQKIGQIAAGAVYDDEGNVIEVRATKRLEAVEELIEQSVAKTIVYVPFKNTAAMVKEFLVDKGYAVGVITSDTRHRQPLFDQFQGRDATTTLDVLVAVPDAVAHGVTLTEASTVIWYGPPRSNEIYQQANARADRKGQVNKVNVVELWGHPRERDIFDMSRLREEDQDIFMELYRRVKSEIETEFFGE